MQQPEKKAAMFENSKRLRIVAGAFWVILGIAALGLSIKILQANNVFNAWNDLAKQGGMSGPTSYVNALKLIPAGGCLLLLGGLFSVAPIKSRFAFVFGMILVVCGSAVLIAAGPSYSKIYTELITVDALLPNNHDPDFDESLLSSDQKLFAEMGTAIFETCCRPHKWVSQLPVKSCDLPYKVCSPDQLTDPRILDFADLLSGVLGQLCGCIANPSAYQLFVDALQRNGNATCEVFKDVRVAFTKDLTVPTTAFKLQTALTTTYPGLEVKDAPLIGWNMDPDTNPDPDSDVAFGCGVGYMKGILWFQQLYFQSFSFIGAAGIAIGALAIFSVVVIVGYAYVSTMEEREDQQDGFNKQFGGQASFAAAGSAAAYGQAAVPYGGPGPDPKQYDSTVMEIAARLREFYAAYDQTKTERDIQNVATFASQQGLVVLNEKLRAKYDADLDSMRVGGVQI